MSRSIVTWMFLLSLVLILVVYYQGSTTFFLGFTSGVTKLVYALTGRNENGQFQAIPRGAA